MGYPKKNHKYALIKAVAFLLFIGAAISIIHFTSLRRWGPMQGTTAIAISWLKITLARLPPDAHGILLSRRGKEGL